MKYINMNEETLKYSVARDFFSKYDCTKVLSKIDFSVCIPGGYAIGDQYFLWAEVKSVKTDVLDMLTQLVLTIGKAKTFNDFLPPPFLGCFDLQSIIFIPYSEIQDIFYYNDFNWNVAPSDRTTKEFDLVKQKIAKILKGDSNSSETSSQYTFFNKDGTSNVYSFDFDKDEVELKTFIKDNFVIGKVGLNKVRIDKNNFIFVYNKWLEQVKPSIMLDWEAFAKDGIVDGDFYLADLISENNLTLNDLMNVVLEWTKYGFNRKDFKSKGYYKISYTGFNDGQAAHHKFWSIYERPPQSDFQGYILERRDLLVPQDIRERKGSFYTPKIWVELSQKYLADVFGVNWQDEYYVWDCAAGTGNLLAGLVNKKNIWASTLDSADVDVMHDRIKKGANLNARQVFQFDFLNDKFTKLPAELQRIIAEEPEKLIIYINPPYAEAASANRKGNKQGLKASKIQNKYMTTLGKPSNEIFAQFLFRIYKEIPRCKIAHFSKLKILGAPNFAKFREVFQAKLEKLFLAPADTFDNVSGQFPIGFHIWDSDKKEVFKKITANVYDSNGRFLSHKTIINYDSHDLIGKWYSSFYDNNGQQIGVMNTRGNDFQNYNSIYISSVNNFNHTNIITINNLIHTCIYLTVRHCIRPTWLNDRDQFLFPNDGWIGDKEFQSDCLAFTLFHNANNISSKHGINHWIPFNDNEVRAKDSFASHFMANYIAGKIKKEHISSGSFDFVSGEGNCPEYPPLIFSALAQNVLDKGRELWKYYHSLIDLDKSNKLHPYDVNASFYDIREYFQGRNEAGRMNSKSSNEMYNMLLGELRLAMKLLAEQIKPKVYEYGFLMS